MRTRAAKGRKFFSLAAVCVLIAAVLAPAPASASRTLPRATAPVVERLPALEIAGAAAAVAGQAEPLPLYTFVDVVALDRVAGLDDHQLEAAVGRQRHRLHLVSTELARPGELVWGSKTATGVSTWSGADKHLEGSDLRPKLHRPSFQGLWTDPVTGLSYARNRWYDARSASWLSEDPMGAVDSPNLYAFVGWGPHMFVDPLGLMSYKEAAGRGESFLVEHLKRQGWRVFYGGPVAAPGVEPHRWNEGGPDAIAYNPDTDELAFFDDRNTKKVRVRKVTSLIENFESGPAISNARRSIMASDMPDELKADLLDRLAAEPPRVSKKVTGAAPESNTIGVTDAVADQNVEFHETRNLTEAEVAKQEKYARWRERHLRGKAGGTTGGGLGRRVRGGGSVLIISFVLSAFSADPSEAFHDSLDPLAFVTGTTSIPLTDEEAYELMVEREMLLRIGEELVGWEMLEEATNGYQRLLNGQSVAVAITPQYFADCHTQAETIVSLHTVAAH